MQRFFTIAFSALLVAGETAAYDLNDASYVTSSKNVNVLAYVVCLHDELGNTPKNLSNLESLDVAEKACAGMAAKLPGGSDEPNAEDLKMMVTECGFQPSDASPDMGCGPLGAQPTSPTKTGTSK